MSSRIRANLALLLVAVIWGSAFVAQRIAAVDAGVFLFNGFRFLLGSLVLVPFMKRPPLANPGALQLNSLSPAAAIDRSHLPGILAAGFLLFAGGGLQQAGLMYTTAGNAAFITGLYVVFVPIIQLVLWRKPIRPVIWAAALLAAGGALLLSNVNFFREFRLGPGDGLELLGAVMWAFHVIVVGRMVQKLDALRFSAGQFAAAGLMNLLVGVFLEQGRFSAILDAWWSIAYTGIFSVGVGYTLQAVGQKHAPPADAAIILSMEAVFAALSGYFILSETLRPIQLLGCVVIFIAIVVAVLSGENSQRVSDS